jgi:hypothetical protein
LVTSSGFEGLSLNNPGLKEAINIYAVSSNRFDNNSKLLDPITSMYLGDKVFVKCMVGYEGRVAIGW